MDLPHIRVGLGHDVHRTASGKPLFLGGMRLEADVGLVGHSDADVLLHAVTDALLGAAGRGDIGEWFPDSDERYAGADSVELLNEVLVAVRSDGWTLVNMDCTVFAERPRLAPYKADIRRRLAELTGLSVEAVNVKAKTGEKVGPVGRGEAIQADAVVLLAKADV